MSKPKYKIGDTVLYHGTNEVIAKIMSHPKGWLYTFESCQHLAVLEDVLTGDMPSVCQSIDKETP